MTDLPPPPRWLVLMSPADREQTKLDEFLHLAGAVALPEKSDEVPDGVLLGQAATKTNYLRAGFWRGYGVPVVFVTKDRERGGLSRTYGFWVTDADGFRRMFLEPHPYLCMRPYREAAAQRAEAVEAATPAAGA